MGCLQTTWTEFWVTLTHPPPYAETFTKQLLFCVVVIRATPLPPWFVRVVCTRPLIQYCGVTYWVVRSSVDQAVNCRSRPMMTSGWVEEEISDHMNQYFYSTRGQQAASLTSLSSLEKLKGSTPRLARRAQGPGQFPKLRMFLNVWTFLHSEIPRNMNISYIVHMLFVKLESRN